MVTLAYHMRDKAYVYKRSNFIVPVYIRLRARSFLQLISSLDPLLKAFGVKVTKFVRGPNF